MKLTKNKGLFISLICCLAYHAGRGIEFFDSFGVNVIAMMGGVSGATLGAELSMAATLANLISWFGNLSGVVLIGAALILDEKHKRKGAIITASLAIAVRETLFILGGVVMETFIDYSVWTYPFAARLGFFMPIQIVLLLYVICRNKNSVLWRVLTIVGVAFMVIPGGWETVYYISHISRLMDDNMTYILERLYNYLAYNGSMVMIYLFGMAIKPAVAVPKAAPVAGEVKPTTAPTESEPMDTPTEAEQSDEPVETEQPTAENELEQTTMPVDERQENDM